MDFELTKEREVYIDATGKVILNACPGSGKTTTIGYKLAKLTKDWKKNNYHYCGIACLSFTNVAKEEIHKKYKEVTQTSLSHPHLVSTIDSFINTYITLPYYQYLIKAKIRPTIFDYSEFNETLYNQKWIMNYRNNKKQPLFYFYPPGNFHFSINGDFNLPYQYNQTDVSKDVFEKYRSAIFKWIVSNGNLKVGDSAYFSLQILKSFTRIAQWLAKRFPHIIIDEAQDTSEIQHTIIGVLLENGLNNVELIGDPYQAVYEWREARPDLFLKKFEDVKNWKPLYLNQSRRSSQNIVNYFSVLRKNTDPPISAINQDCLIPLKVYKYQNGKINDIVPKYESYLKELGLKKNQIVVRGNALKDKLLGKKGDAEPWKSPLPYQIINSKNQFDGKAIKNAINQIRKIYIDLQFPDMDYKMRKEKESELTIDSSINAILFNVLKNLPSFNYTISDWSNQTQLYIKEKFSLSNSIDFQIKQRKSSRFNPEILNEQIKLHFHRAVATYETPITTIHQVKGMTFDSLLFILNEKSHKENITFSDIIGTDIFPEEKQRLIYVAMSRPRYLLALGVPETVSDEEIKRKFGDNISIE
ncbi:MAG: ATP-dependent helicase [Bacteroidetes bacterium]|nr:ATP-dependent helicase [Bacteroidota bacterium]